jgi:hypothetical protein
MIASHARAGAVRRHACPVDRYPDAMALSSSENLNGGLIDAMNRR